MQIVERAVGPVTVLDLVGRMTRNDGYGTVQAHVKDLAARDRTRILLNLAGVPYMDSSCVGELVSAFISVQSRNGRVKLLRLDGRIRQLFAVARLDTVFEIFDDEQRAIASFGV